MKKQRLLLLTAAFLGTVFFVGSVYSAQQAADEITMNSKVYPHHKKTLVAFSHKKHNVAYKVVCTDCHHAFKDGKNVWKDGDEIKKCDSCHSKTKAPTGKDAPKMSTEEKIKEFHYSAIHENCMGCHKANKKAGKKTPGPTACKECHPKK
jgi:hypothetical protein